jgi:CRP-like cAMP-binding protein
MASKASENLVQFRKGEVLFREGTPGDYFFVIRSGQVQVSKSGKNGAIIPLAVLSSGQCVGEFSVFDGRARSATVTALSDITAVRITAATVEQQLKKLPSWFVTITRNLIDRIREVDNVLKRNNIVDEQLSETIRAIEYNTGKGPTNSEKSPEESGEPAETGSEEI